MQKRFDSYKSQSRTESAGLYEVAQDKNGNRVIKFDTLKKETENQIGERNLEKNGGGEEEKPIIVKTMINTDSIEREIQNLKQTKVQLAQQVAGAEPEKAKSAEATLTQVERELQAKDNDAYRKQHADVQQTTV